MSRFIRNKVAVDNPNATMVCVHAPPGKRPRFDPRGENIFLVGLRGSGKTTLGRLLAVRLEVAFVDTDEAVARKNGADIAGIVSMQGWEAFRTMETQILRDVCARKGQVVATGGGIVLDPNNRELMERSGVVFYLMAEISTLADRLARQPLAAQRPALTNLSLAQELGQCRHERGPLYMCIADHLLHAEKEPAVLVEEVLEKLGLAGR